MPELIDITTPQGVPTGERKPKPEIHRDGDWHVAAHVWIVTPDDRVLLQRRADAKETYPGLWDVSAAGHVSAGESALETAVRETEEELGLVIAPEELQPIGRAQMSVVFHGGTYRENEVHEVFLVRREIDLESLRPDPSEVSEVALVPAAELRAKVERGDTELVPHSEYRFLFEVLGAD